MRRDSHGLPAAVRLEVLDFDTVQHAACSVSLLRAWVGRGVYALKGAAEYFSKSACRDAESEGRSGTGGSRKPLKLRLAPRPELDRRAAAEKKVIEKASSSPRSRTTRDAAPELRAPGWTYLQSSCLSVGIDRLPRFP